MKDRTVWRNLSQRDAAVARVSNSAFDVDPGMAGHLSCMIFSAFACPYWSSPVGRLGKDSAIQPGAPRGTRPAILGFKDIVMMASEDTRRPFLGGPETFAANALFGYVELDGDHGFRQPDDLLSLYEDACAADVADIDLSAERAYWTASTADQYQLTKTLDTGIRAMRSAAPDRHVSYNGENWTAFAIPLI